MEAKSASDRELAGDTSAESNPKRSAEENKLQVLKSEQVSPEGAKDGEAGPGKTELPKKRMIVRDAVLGLESGSPKDAQIKVAAVATTFEGYIVESTNNINVESLDGGGNIRLVLRVPAEKFDAAVDAIKKTADRVVTERITGKDVTEQFVDIQARLKAKKALEERFLEIMKQAKNVADALNVQRELANVRSQIEVIEGRKRLLENQASLSKITVSIGPPNTISSSSSGFWYQLQDAVSDGVEGALTIILFLVRLLIALIPLLLIIVLPLLFVFRFLWKKYKNYRISRAMAAEASDIEKDIGKGVIDIEQDH
jgi:hypothetical protein